MKQRVFISILVMAMSIATFTGCASESQRSIENTVDDMMQGVVKADGERIKCFTSAKVYKNGLDKINEEQLEKEFYKKFSFTIKKMSDQVRYKQGIILDTAEYLNDNSRTEIKKFCKKILKNFAEDYEVTSIKEKGKEAEVVVNIKYKFDDEKIDEIFIESQKEIEKYACDEVRKNNDYYLEILEDNGYDYFNRCFMENIIKKALSIYEKKLKKIQLIEEKATLTLKAEDSNRRYWTIIRAKNIKKIV